MTTEFREVMQKRKKRKKGCGMGSVSYLSTRHSMGQPPREVSCQVTEYQIKHAPLPVCNHLYTYRCELPVRSLFAS